MADAATDIITKAIAILPAIHVVADAPTLAQLTLALAIGEIGTREEGKANWGPKVEAYLAAVGIYTPAAWCGAFVNWCAEQAAAHLGTVSPLEQVPLQGYVQSYVDYGTKHDWVVSAPDARPGDLCCFYSASLKRYAHIGIVESLDVTKGVFQSIEGNTNNDGSREGYEVLRKTRALVATTRFLRWAPVPPR